MWYRDGVNPLYVTNKKTNKPMTKRQQTKKISQLDSEQKKGGEGTKNKPSQKKTKWPHTNTTFFKYNNKNETHPPYQCSLGLLILLPSFQIFQSLFKKVPFLFQLCPGCKHGPTIKVVVINIITIRIESPVGDKKIVVVVLIVVVAVLL